MALQDALKAGPPQVRTGFRSKVDIWRESLDEADRNAFDAAVKNPEWTNRALVEIVNAEGLDISEPGFRAWRVGTLRRAA